MPPFSSAAAGRHHDPSSNSTGIQVPALLLQPDPALAATLLAALGVYGVTAYAVSQRTREIGIRKALGASTAGVATLVAGRVALVAGAGIAAGLASAAALSRLIEPQLWGVGSTDPATYAGAARVVLTVALAACLFPVRRALAVDPTTALRAE